MAIDNLLTAKQQEVLQSYLHDDWRVLILSGAVRAGKTYISDWIFLLELRRVARLAKAQNNPHPVVILAGYSSNSIYTNVIVSIENEFGVELKPDRHGHYHLFGVDIVPAYTGNKRGMSAIRGATAYSAYIDEGSLADQSVFQEILQRCSIEGSRIIVTTNPGSPVHYLKTDYIDNTDPEARIRTFNFTIDDNTRLSPEYVNSLKAQTPSGMFTDRAIYGLWVSGEGLVYRDFDKNRMMIDKLPPDRSYKYYCGVDWGFEHKGSIVVLADDDKGNTYLIEEHTKKHKFIDYWVNIAKDIQKRYGYNVIFFTDGARPDNYNEFLRNGINARNANKDILAGVESVAELMATKHFYVLKNAPVKFLDEIYQYVWDSDKGVPAKQNDDVVDAVRYGIFSEHLNSDAQFINSAYI